MAIITITPTSIDSTCSYQLLLLLHLILYTTVNAADTSTAPTKTNTEISTTITTITAATTTTVNITTTSFPSCL